MEITLKFHIPNKTQRAGIPDVPADWGTGGREQKKNGGY
jgi:hypothetical protein